MHPLAASLLKKAGILAITLLGASLLAFSLIRMVPGDPVMMLLGERGADPAVVAELKARMGLDKPILEQYGIFLKNALKGDLGDSVVSKRPVNEEFFSRFPATLELGIVSLFFAVLFGIPLGVWAAVKRNSFINYVITGVSLVGYSMPIFWWGLILILFFSINLGLTPVSGRISIIYDITPVTGFLLLDTWLSGEGWQAFKSAFLHLILPAIALGTIPLAVIVRMTRSSMLEVLSEDYVRTAKARGISGARLVFKHALRNALIPIITVIGLMVGSIMTGAVLTETIFSWPGIGRWLVKSVEARDYPVIQGGILYISFLIVMINFAVDILYVWANPRMRGKL